MASELRRGYLYRAERVNIRPDIPFGAASIDVIENADNIVSVDTCAEPPFDQPPYTNASGDFILIDRASFIAIRGVDESVRKARLHLDSRCVISLHRLDLPTVLLGRIFHISHRLSLTNVGAKFYREDPSYDYLADLPYFNGENWGLGWAAWTQPQQRLKRVSMPRSGRSAPDPESSLEGTDRQRVDELRRRLYAAGIAGPRTWPGPPDEEVPARFGTLTTHPYWPGASVENNTVLTTAERWAYAAEIPSTLEPSEDGYFYWIRVTLHVARGAVGVGLLSGTDLIAESAAIQSDQPVVLHLGIQKPSSVSAILFRNVSDEGASVAEVLRVALVRKTASDTLNIT